MLDFRDNETTVNRRFGTIDLNPPGRRQTIKYRPKIRLTANLSGWLDEWQKPPVDKEQRDVWLGHDEKRTANAYEAFDPDYLADCMQATEKVIAELQKHTRKRLFARKLRANAELKVIEVGKKVA